MADMHKLKEMLHKELREYERKGELSAGSLDVIHKITDTIKNIDKIEMLEQYGESDESYEGGGSTPDALAPGTCTATTGADHTTEAAVPMTPAPMTEARPAAVIAMTTERST